MADTHDDDLLSIRQVAAENGVSEETIRLWMRKGAIPYTEVGPNRLRRVKRSVSAALKREIGTDSATASTGPAK